jgi:hypothetical protein
MFYFSQTIWRIIQSNNLSKKYSDDDIYHLNIEKWTALAFVLVIDIVQRFDLMVANLEDEADSFLNYFEKIWIDESNQSAKYTLFELVQLLMSYIILNH